MIARLLCVLLAISYAHGLYLNNAENKTASWEYGSYISPEEHLSYGLKFYTPTKPGNYQVVVFMGGLDGKIPGLIYEQFGLQFSQVSNRILILFSRLQALKKPIAEEAQFAETLDWLVATLPKILTSDKAPESVRNGVRADLTTNGITLMTHSSAGHIITLYLQETCGIVTKLVMLDPVDGTDPFGFDKDYVIKAGHKLLFQIPTLISASELGAVSVFRPLPACAPKKLSNERFYNALTGPTWYLNFTRYGHADFLDDWAIECCSSVACKTCYKDCDFRMYRSNLIRAIVYFIRGVDERNATDLNAIENPKSSGMFDPALEINSVYNMGGFNVIKTGPFCHHK